MRISNYHNFSIKNEKIFVSIIIILIIPLFFNYQSSGIYCMNSYRHKEILYNDDYNGYILKFCNESISSFWNRIRNEKNFYSLNINENFLNRIIKQRILSYKNEILSLHRRAKVDILKLLELESNDLFMKDFLTLINGIMVKNIPVEMFSKIINLPYVDKIFPNSKIRISLDSSIPLIGADLAWNFQDCFERNVTGEGVSIAIMDTGVDYEHTDLKDNYIGGYDFVNDDDDPFDDNGHGTHCAGILAGSGGASNFRFVGVAPDVDLYVYKVINSQGIGYSSWLIEGMERAIDPNCDGDFSDHVDIISISAGDSSGNPSDPLSLAANNAVDIGVVVVASAGNEGPAYDTIISPGCAKRVICVGATDKNDRIANFSSRGSNYYEFVKPFIVAPGVEIISSWPGDNYMILSGTSMACPHVAGTVALLLQMHPNWNPDEIEIVLRKNTIDLDYNQKTQGYGRLSAINVVNMSNNLPFSLLNMSKEFERGIVDVYGTAMSNDFHNYSLYYRKSNDSSYIDWIKIYEGVEQIKENILYKWNTTNLSEGYYDLKLEVRSIDYLSRDRSMIYLKNKNNGSDVKISIIQPMKNVLYLWGIPIPILFKETVIIGNITILASVNYLKPINRIELYIDDEIKRVDLNNFEKTLIQWNWDEKILFRHYIKIVVYDNDGLMSSEEMEVWIFNL